jgi:uncharacterized membrane protein YdjX (TVP38/TMEM64 family)
MVRRHRLAAGAVALGVVCGWVVLSPAVAVRGLRDLLTSPWFPAVLVGLYLARPFLAWPITLLSALVGFRYGVVAGLPLALAGAVATSLIPYAAGRRVPPGSGLLGRLRAGSRRFFDSTGGFRGVTAARLAPTPAEAVSGAAGAAGVSLPAFVLGTLVGELPWTVAAVVAGASMGRLAPETPALGPWLTAAGVLAALALLAGPAYRYARTRSVAPVE